METLREHFEARGAEKRIQHIIKNMLEQGVSDEQICIYTGIAAQDLAKLKRDILNIQ